MKLAPEIRRAVARVGHAVSTVDKALDDLRDALEAPPKRERAPGTLIAHIEAHLHRDRKMAWTAQEIAVLVGCTPREAMKEMQRLVVEGQANFHLIAGQVAFKADGIAP